MMQRDELVNVVALATVALFFLLLCAADVTAPCRLWLHLLGFAIICWAFAGTLLAAAVVDERNRVENLPPRG